GFVFNAVPLGIYTLRETVPAGFVQTVPGGAGTISVTISESAPNSTGNLFGNRQAGGVSGTKFNDLNGNGVRDAGEPGLSGVTITPTARGDGEASATLSVVTDAQGNFTFANVPFGAFTLTETPPPGCTQLEAAAAGQIAPNG